MDNIDSKRSVKNVIPWCAG